MLTTLAKNWWLLALRGLMAIIFGILAFIWPGMTLVVLVLMFGAYAFLDGLFELIAVITRRTGAKPAWAGILEGLVGIAAGIGAFIWPQITAMALLYLIAAWAIVTGVLEILTAIRLREEIDNEWFLALAGALSVIFGVLLVIFPGTGALALVWMIGGYAVAFGILLIVLAFRLRRMGASGEVEARRPA
jgi:uncharacterized membrane protein HdeD (DUF308 family)